MLLYICFINGLLQEVLDSDVVVTDLGHTPTNSFVMGRDGLNFENEYAQVGLSQTFT